MRDLRERQAQTTSPEQLAKLSAAIAPLREQIAATSAALANTKEAASPAAVALKTALETLRGAAALPGAALQELAAAANGVVGLFGGVASSIGRFVEASNPALMEQFNLAVRDLA